jgi:hypothetical protein
MTMSSVFFAIFFSLMLATAAAAGYVTVGLLQSHIAPQARARRLHCALGRDALASHDLNHAWTRTDIHQLPTCRRLSIQQRDIALDTLTASGALTIVGQKGGQELYRLPRFDLISGLGLDEVPNCHSLGLAWWEERLLELETTWA